MAPKISSTRVPQACSASCATSAGSGAVAEITAEFRDASAMVVTEYRGLSMKQITQLRRSLGSDVNYTVAKNTLVKRAAADAGVEGLDDLLVGPTAIAFVTGEPVDAAKALRDAARTNPTLVLKGGSFGDQPISAADITAMADLPSREELLARFAGALQAPLVKTAGLLQALPRNLAYGLSALIEQRETAAAA